jgi:hypothetical protein
LLGCLVGVRTLGQCGLAHVDGRSDFYHPGNYEQMLAMYDGARVASGIVYDTLTPRPKNVLALL